MLEYKSKYNVKLKTLLVLLSLFVCYSKHVEAHEYLPHRFLTFKVGYGITNHTIHSTLEDVILGEPYTERYVKTLSNYRRVAAYRKVIPVSYEPINVNETSSGNQFTLEGNVRLLNFNSNRDRLYAGIRINVAGFSDRSEFESYYDYPKSVANFGLNFTFEHNINPNLIWAIGVSGSQSSSSESKSQAYDFYTSIMYKNFGVELNLLQHYKDGLGRYGVIEQKFDSTIIGLNVFYQLSL